MGGIVTTPLGEPPAGRALVTSTALSYGVPVQVVQVGSSYVVGSVRLVVLGPERLLAGTRSDPNNNSVVLRAVVGGHSVLLAGDAETEEQHSLLEAPLRAEIMKVAHHGSSFQDPAFLAAVDPSVALVSVGQGNDYGHPNAAVLSHLARSGVRVLRTDLDGDLAVVARGDRLAAVASPVRAASARSKPFPNSGPLPGLELAHRCQTPSGRQDTRSPACGQTDHSGLPRGGTTVAEARAQERVTMAGIIRAAIVQTSWTGDKESMIKAHEEYARQAAASGAKVICFQELFYGPYFCQVQDAQYYAYAESVPGPTVERFSALAAELGMVMVLPMYEQEQPGVLYNTAAVVDADGTYLGKFRKTHIPQVKGFWEKFYFRPGNLGYPVFDTAVGKVGVYLCYDEEMIPALEPAAQHFCEGGMRRRD